MLKYLFLQVAYCGLLNNIMNDAMFENHGEFSNYEVWFDFYSSLADSEF